MYNNPLINSKKRNVLEHFLKVCPNYSIELGEYKVKRDEPEFIKGLFKLDFFVRMSLKKAKEFTCLKRRPKTKHRCKAV
jgi:hypothetical protein